MGIIAILFGFGKKKKKALMAIVMVSLIMSLLCTVLVSSVAAQSVSVSFDNASIEETDKCFVVNGTVTGSGLNSQGVPVADTVYVIADIKELPNSKYQKFFSFFLFWVASQKPKNF